MVTKDTTKGIEEACSIAGLLTDSALGPCSFVRCRSDRRSSAAARKCVDRSCVQIDDIIGVNTEVVSACDRRCKVTSEHECVVVRVVSNACKATTSVRVIIDVCTCGLAVRLVGGRLIRKGEVL